MTTHSPSSTAASTWLDVVTILVILGLIGFEVVARTGRPSVMMTLGGLVLSLLTRRHDRQARSDEPAPSQESVEP